MSEEFTTAETEEDVETIEAVQVNMAAQLEEMISDVMVTCQELIPDNPSLPHSMLITCLARTVGQIITLLPESVHGQMQEFAVRELVDQVHAEQAAGNIFIHREFGNA